MLVKSIENYQAVHFLQDEPKNFDKKKEAAIAGTGIAVVGGLIALANYNKPRVIKSATNNCVNFGAEKFMELCKSSKLEHYVASTKNIQEKIFRNDLHSHSNHSDGWGKVANILNQVAEYADELHSKTGQKFTFALTDHDRVSGVREANAIIKNNPEKFKNINFVPGVELSFSFNSNGQVKTGELLAYFVDPNSKAMQTLVEDLNKNREKMIVNCIDKLGEGFSRSDMDNYFLNHDGETFAYNLHYRLRNYAQIKNRINKMAKIWNDDAGHLYKYFMDGYVFGHGRVPKPFVSPEGFNEYLKRTNVYTETQIIDENIDKICNEFFPKIVNGRVVSDTENSFEKIIDTLKDDDNVILAFAHPYFTAKQMSNYKKEFSELLNFANGKIKLSENYHQAYSSNIPKNEIEEINNFLLGKNLIPIGGRDNHAGSFWG